MQREDLARDLKGLVGDLLIEQNQLNAAERGELVEQLLNDMLGLGLSSPCWPMKASRKSWSTAPSRSMSKTKDACMSPADQ